VITAVNGHARWVNVRKGLTFGDQVALRGDIKAGQKVVKRASDEIREGTPPALEAPTIERRPMAIQMR